MPVKFDHYRGCWGGLHQKRVAHPLLATTKRRLKVNACRSCAHDDLCRHDAVDCNCFCVQPLIWVWISGRSSNATDIFCYFPASHFGLRMALLLCFHIHRRVEFSLRSLFQSNVKGHADDSCIPSDACNTHGESVAGGAAESCSTQANLVEQRPPFVPMQKLVTRRTLVDNLVLFHSRVRCVWCGVGATWRVIRRWQIARPTGRRATGSCE